MRPEENGVVLSRRNLLSLLAKLDGAPRPSARTLLAPPSYGSFYVTAEEDEVHYAHPSREDPEAGPVHPETVIRAEVLQESRPWVPPDGDTFNAGLGPYT